MPQTISPATKSGFIAAPLLSVDEAGDAVASWRSNSSLEWAAHDISGPVLSGLSIPAAALVGQPAAFSLAALDTFSSPVLTEWTFGDGGTAAGPASTHTYSAPGRFPVTVRSTDALGNATTAAGSVSVAAAPPGAARAPKLESLSQSRRLWRRGRARASVARKHRLPPVGTSFSFKLDQAAQVKLTFRQAATGRRAKGHCVAPSHKNRHAHRCVRTLARGTLTVAGHAGLDKLAFQGRISSSRSLPPGAYTVTFVATNAAALSSPSKRLTFQLVR